MTPDIETLLENMARELRARMEADSLDAPLMIGIHTGGVWVAQALQRRLGLAHAPGELDISFYRDDFSRIGMHPRVKPSKLPFDVEERHVILIDDVLYTGRTIRAAMNEIFDFGRPASITLAVLIERSGRELPIEAQVVGSRETLTSAQQVKLSGPEPLELSIVTPEHSA